MKLSSTFVLMLTALMVLALASPLVIASSETGANQNRVVTLTDQYAGEATNATVTVPNILSNASANSFAFVILDESAGTDDYTFNITIWDNNATWYNGSVDITTIVDDNVTGYVNFTADTFALVNNANITVTMIYTGNYSVADVWYGEVDIISENTYAMRVTVTGIIMSVMGLAIMLMFMVKIFQNINMTSKDD